MERLTDRARICNALDELAESRKDGEGFHRLDIVLDHVNRSSGGTLPDLSLETIWMYRDTFGNSSGGGGCIASKETGDGIKNRYLKHEPDNGSFEGLAPGIGGIASPVGHQAFPVLSRNGL